MSKDSREAAESALARLCEWRRLDCYIWAKHPKVFHGLSYNNVITF